MINIVKSVDLFYKLAQEASTSKNFLYNNLVKETPSDINLAITQLNAGKTKIPATNTTAINAIDQIVTYLKWRTNISNINDASSKKELIPNDNEIVAIINTGIFGPQFVLSLTKILGLTNSTLYNSTYSAISRK
jgi:hypothetical protein